MNIGKLLTRKIPIYWLLILVVLSIWFFQNVQNVNTYTVRSNFSHIQESNRSIGVIWHLYDELQKLEGPVQIYDVPNVLQDQYDGSYKRYIAQLLSDKIDDMHPELGAWDRTPWSTSSECKAHQKLAFEELLDIQAQAKFYTGDDVAVPGRELVGREAVERWDNANEKLYECYKAEFMRKFMLW
jgi:hypothetical protein